MTVLSWQKELSRDGHRLVFAGQPFTMHCHHYNINLQKTLEDTLGDEGIDLLYQSAAESNYISFQTLANQYTQIKTKKSKMEMAATLFQNSGLGIIHFQKIGPEGGRIISPSSHHVTGWLAKHGKRNTPGCHFTRGWIAGLMAVLYDRSPDEFIVTETSCKMMRDPECVFTIRIAENNMPST